MTALLMLVAILVLSCSTGDGVEHAGKRRRWSVTREMCWRSSPRAATRRSWRLGSPRFCGGWSGR